MFLSIIISVYNIETFISQCISSILSQNFEDYEVVVIDDGSTDRSPEVCRNFAIDNPLIKYFRKDNGGASSARNFGLQKANGDYVIFMDGDDFLVGTSFFTELHAKAGDLPDFIMYGCWVYNHRTGISKVSHSNYGLSQAGGLFKEQIITTLVEQHNFPGAAWLFCIKKEFLQKKLISFKEGIKAEDLDWIFSVFQHSERMSFLDSPFYMYRKNREGSVTGTFDRKSIDGLLYFIKKWAPLVTTNAGMGKMAFIINYHYIILVLFAGKLTKKDIGVLNSHRYILTFSLTRQLYFISQFIRILGLRNSNMLFHRLLSYVRSK